MKLDPHALKFLIRCANDEEPTCIVADMTTHIQIRKITQFKIGPYVSHLVTSEEVRAELEARLSKTEEKLEVAEVRQREANASVFALI
jgi:FMN phosphatase YigB (HAD superfamily)